MSSEEIAARQTAREPAGTLPATAAASTVTRPMPIPTSLLPPRMTTKHPSRPTPPAKPVPSSSRSTSLAGHKRPRESDEGTARTAARRTKSTSDALAGTRRDDEAYKRGMIRVFVASALTEVAKVGIHFTIALTSVGQDGALHRARFTVLPNADHSNPRLSTPRRASPGLGFQHLQYQSSPPPLTHHCHPRPPLGDRR